MAAAVEVAAVQEVAPAEAGVEVLNAEVNAEVGQVNQQAEAEVQSQAELIAAEWAELSPKVASAISELLGDVDKKTTSLKKMRRRLAEHLGLGKKGLELHVEAVSSLLVAAMHKASAGVTPAASEHPPRPETQ